MKFKFTIMLAALLAAFLALIATPARAYDDIALTLRTNSVLASTARLYSNSIYVGNQASVDLHLEFKLDAAATDNISFLFARGVSSSFDSRESLNAKKTYIPIAATGTTTSVTITNVLAKGSGYIYLEYITNACASANLTNLVIRYGGGKPNANP